MLSSHSRYGQELSIGSLGSGETTNPQVPLSPHASSNGIVPTISSKSSHGSDRANNAKPKQLLIGKDLDKIVKDINSFVKVAEEVLSIRVSAQQKRQDLARYRRNVSETDEALMKVIRRHHAGGTAPDPGSLFSLYDACQEARNELGPLEDEYEKKEFLLIPKEDDLNEIGEKIERRYKRLARSYPNSASSTASSELRSSSPSTSYNEKTTPTALMANEALEGQMEQLPQQPLAPFPFSGQKTTCASTQPVDLDLDTESLTHQFVPSFKLKQSSDLACSRPDGHQAASFVEDRSLANIEDTKIDTIGQGYGLLLGSEIDTHSSLPDHPNSIQSSHDQVNHWLLQRLRGSRLEILKLREAVEVEINGVGSWTGADVLAQWSLDEAATSRTPAGSKTASSGPTDTMEGSYVHVYTSSAP